MNLDELFMMLFQKDKYLQLQQQRQQQREALAKRYNFDPLYMDGPSRDYNFNHGNARSLHQYRYYNEPEPFTLEDFNNMGNARKNYKPPMM